MNKKLELVFDEKIKDVTLLVDGVIVGRIDCDEVITTKYIINLFKEGHCFAAFSNAKLTEIN